MNSAPSPKNQAEDSVNANKKPLTTRTQITQPRNNFGSKAAKEEFKTVKLCNTTAHHLEPKYNNVIMRDLMTKVVYKIEKRLEEEGKDFTILTGVDPSQRMFVGQKTPVLGNKN